MRRRFPPSFLVYVGSTAFGIIGNSIVFVALPFLVLQVTHSEVAVAQTIFWGSVPRFLGLFLGRVVDRASLKPLLVVSQVLRACVLVALGILFAFGNVQMLMVYAAQFTVNSLNVAVIASQGVLTPRWVPPQELQRANSLLSGVSMGIPLIGYSTGGILAARLPTAAPLYIAGAANVIAGVLLLATVFPERASRPQDVPAADFFEFFRVIMGRAFWIFLLLLTVGLNFTLNVLNVRMPVLMEELRYGATGYGIFEGALSLGLISGVVLVFALGKRLPVATGISLGGMALTLGILTLWGNRLSFFAIGALAAGAGMGSIQVNGMTLLQDRIPEGLRGQAVGAAMALSATGLVAGAWFAGKEAGVAASRLFLGLGMSLLVLTIAWALSARCPEHAAEDCSRA